MLDALCQIGISVTVSLVVDVFSQFVRTLFEVCFRLYAHFNSTYQSLVFPIIQSCSGINVSDEEAVVLEKALLEFTKMREREGERIKEDLLSRVNYMRSVAKEVERRSPETVIEYKNKLYQKIKDVLEDREVDEARVLTEVAIFADKIAVNEETVRLTSHFDEFEEILKSDEPVGRRLDFLIQEINREINTTGSKANDIEIARYVVDLKGETEKLREQVQNIE